jgi:hypothetical protein
VSYRPLSAAFRVLAVFAAVALLCAFDHGSGQLLEIPRGGNNNRSPAATYEDSTEAVPAGPDLRFHQLLKFYGCWKATVTRRELTEFSAAGQRPRKWTDRHYTICFARDMGGELQPTMSQSQTGNEDIEDKGSSTQIVGFDNEAVTLVNRYRFVDHNATRQAAGVSWFGLRRAPKAVEVQQITQVSCLRESLDLICSASATAQCGATSCNSFSWKARFYAF